MSCPTRTMLTLALVMGAQLVHAATFTANRSEDLPDANPGDGICQALPTLPGDGQCTLRAAIMEANALEGTHTIHLESGRTYTMSRQGVDDTAVLGDLDIHRTMTIECPNCAERPIVNGNGIDRIFDVHDASLTLRNFDITGGNSLGPNGGAIRAGNDTDALRLISMRVYGNQAGGVGGAILTTAALTVISNSELFNNIGESGGSALSASGPGTVSIFESAIHGNEAFEGGGIAAVSLSGIGFTIRNSTISGNIGIGLMNWGLTEGGVILNTTIAGNTDGGIFVPEAVPDSLRIRNSIIARNGGEGDCSGTNFTISGNGYNIYSDSTCVMFAAPTDLQNVDPLLTPLKYRSAASYSTPLHWPSPLSPALSAGAIEQTGALACDNADQIGEVRPQGYNGIVRCDIGAAEVPDDAIFFDSLETL